MGKTKRVFRTIGKICLVVVGCALAPILIWVALGVALHQRARAKAVGKPAPRIGEILAAAGRPQR
jgi:hypothetical protein